MLTRLAHCISTFRYIFSALFSFLHLRTFLHIICAFFSHKLLKYEGHFEKFLAWSFISVTEILTLSCLVSF